MSDDFIKATNAHEYRMFEERRRADDRRREQMNTRIGYVMSALVAIVVVVTIVGAFAFHANRSAERDQEVRLACTEQGGSWVSLGTNADPVCIQIKEVQP